MKMSNIAYTMYFLDIYQGKFVYNCKIQYKINKESKNTYILYIPILVFLYWQKGGNSWKLIFPFAGKSGGGGCLLMSKTVRLQKYNFKYT